MNPRDFLDVADEWSMGNREAEWRSAASRAYYALFHGARLLLRRCGFPAPHGDQAHAYVWMRLANCSHIELQRAGNELGRLRGIRNRADYDLDHPFAALIAIDQVQLSLDIMELFEKAGTMPSLLPIITNAMRSYERDVLGQVTWQP